MKREKLTAERREHVGGNKELRRNGQVPAVLYGAHIEAENLVFPVNVVDKYVSNNTTGSTVDLVVDGKTVLALLKDVQVHPVNRKVLHMDFQALKADEKIKVSIPVILNIADQDSDVMVQQNLNELEIEALPTDLVSEIAVEVPKSEIGDALYVKDLEIMKDDAVEVMTDEEEMIYNVVEVKEFVEPDPDAEAEEVEGEEAEETEGEETAEEGEEAEESTEE